MKAIISDADVLHALAPIEVAAYLRSHGWQIVDQIGTKGVVWSAPLVSGGDAEILLPLDRSLGDYTRRMSEVLQVLEVAEARSQLDIVCDINDATADVIRVRLQSASLEDGSIPIEQAAHVFASAREIMFAAACATATVQPRMVYYGRKPTPASDYLSKVRLGQTERGSFILTIRSLVPPRLTDGQRSLFPDVNPPEGEEPFERRVTLNLARALAAMNGALSRASATNDVTAFQEAVEKGVSANLCEAVAGLSISDTPQDTTISVNWSPTRGVPNGTPSRFHFSSDSLPILRGVARIFREKAPYGTYELRGAVIELKRDEGALAGQVTVAGAVDGIGRKVNVELFGDDYDQAIKAHQSEHPILCEGELVKDGRSYRLQNPRNLTIEA